MKIIRLLLSSLLLGSLSAIAESIVQNVTAKQRFPWNGLVDVKFDVVGDVTEGTYDWNVELVVVATNQVTGEAWIANNLIGETGTAEGTHNIMWDMKAQGLNIKSDDILGCVAGDDTIFVVSTSEDIAQNIATKIKTMMIEAKLD